MKKINTSNTKKIVLSILLSLFAICAINFQYGGKTANNNFQIFNIFGLVFFSILFYKNTKVPDKYSNTFAALLALSQIVGHSVFSFNIDTEIFITLTSFFYATIRFAGFFFLFRIAIAYVLDFIDKHSITEVRPPKLNFLMRWIIIFVSWLPVWLAYFPGIISYDASFQLGFLRSFVTGTGWAAINSHHPIVHTLFLGLSCLGSSFADFKPTTFGTSLHSITQMLILSAALAHMLSYMAKLRIRRGFQIGALVFLCAYPVISLFSFIPVKNMLFIACFIPFITSILDMRFSSEEFFASRRKQCLFVLWTFLTCITLKSTFVILIATIPFLLIAFKPHIKKLAILLAIAIVLNFASDVVFFNVLGATKGDFRESIPMFCQQLGYIGISRGNELTSYERTALREILEIGSYNPRYPDFAKDSFKTENFKANPAKYVGLYLNLMAKYPLDFLKIPFYTNINYWYFDQDMSWPYVVYVETYLGWDILRETLPTYYENDLPRHSLIPPLYYLYQQFSVAPTSREEAASLQISPLSRAIHETPVLSLIFSLATPFWLFLLSFLVLLRKRSKAMIAMIPIYLNFLVYFFGPLAYLRYLVPFICIMPLVLGVMLIEIEDKKKS